MTSSTAADFSEDPEVPIWPRLIRLAERWTIAEKVDGTHAVIVIQPAEPESHAGPGVSVVRCPDGRRVRIRAASRTHWLVPETDARDGIGRDNFGFATWVAAHAGELAALGPGRHHGEWYGAGIGRGYGLTERRFALFDTARWKPNTVPDGVPEELGLVPVLAECEGPKLNATIARCLRGLMQHGSRLVAGAAAKGVIARSAADPRLALKAYIENSGKEAVQRQRGHHAA
ncbi:RNA ligase family protein [Glycomyces terrestris]|nr:RNA ligase family protein [Glycomyces terrestris]